MIDLKSEAPLSFKQAAERMPGRNGVGIHVSALHRWYTHGVAGVKLEALKVGGTLITTVEALERFIDRLNKPDDSTEPDPNQHMEAVSA